MWILAKPPRWSIVKNANTVGLDRTTRLNNCWFINHGRCRGVDCISINRPTMVRTTGSVYSWYWTSEQELGRVVLRGRCICMHRFRCSTQDVGRLGVDLTNCVRVKGKKSQNAQSQLLGRWAAMRKPLEVVRFGTDKAVARFKCPSLSCRSALLTRAIRSFSPLID